MREGAAISPNFSLQKLDFFYLWVKICKIPLISTVQLWPMHWTQDAADLNWYLGGMQTIIPKVYTLYSRLKGVPTAQCTVPTVQCTVPTVQCTVPTVQCTHALVIKKGQTRSNSNTVVGRGANLPQVLAKVQTYLRCCKRCKLTSGAGIL